MLSKSSLKIISIIILLLGLVAGAYLLFLKNGMREPASMAGKDDGFKNATSTAVGSCAQFTDESRRDNCVFIRVTNALDLAGCGSIAAANLRQSCEKNITYDRAKNSEDCGRIADAADKNRCLLKVASAEGINFCAGSADCINKIKFNDAIMANRSSGCLTITDPALRDKCLAATDVSRDTDKDGVTDYNEVNLYHTDPSKADTDSDGLNDNYETGIAINPRNPDTDGDGHKDAEEIKDGFNPCGPGKMPKPDELALDCAKYSK